jgi:hypothetical protein
MDDFAAFALRVIRMPSDIPRRLLDGCAAFVGLRLNKYRFIGLVFVAGGHFFEISNVHFDFFPWSAAPASIFETSSRSCRPIRKILPSGRRLRPQSEYIVFGAS